MTSSELEQAFYKWADEIKPTQIDNQMSDTPYTNLVFKCSDNKTMIVTLMEDSEGYYE